MERLTDSLRASQEREQALILEGQRLAREVQQAQHDRAQLQARFEEADQHSAELSKNNHDLLEQVRLSKEAQEASSSRAASLSEELEEFRTLYVGKVKDLDTLCSEKQVIISQQSRTLDSQKTLLDNQRATIEDLTARLTLSEKERASAQSENMVHTQISDQRALELNWLLKVGVPGCVRSVLNSDAFGIHCASLQDAVSQLGKAKGCSALREKYPDLLGDKPLLFSDEGLKEVILERYERMVSSHYELFDFVAQEGVDAEALKKRLEAEGMVPVDANLP